MIPSSASPSITRGAMRLLRRVPHPRACYVGIDVGIDQVHVATLGSNRATISGGRPGYGWLSQSSFELPVDPHQPPQPDWVDLVVEILRDRLPRCVDGDRNHAVISLPLPWIHYQTTPESEIDATASMCDSMFTASIFASQAHICRWPVIAGKEQFLIAATAESAACRIARSIAAVGYDVHAILPHGVALLGAASTLTSLTPSAVLLLELSGGLVAIGQADGCGLCRNLPACSLPVSQQPYVDEIDPWLQEIASEFNATSRYVTRLSGEFDTQSPILICGRAARIDGMDAALATMLGRPVAVWRYAGRARPRRYACAVDRSASDASIAVSLSLACCGLQSLAMPGRRER